MGRISRISSAVAAIAALALVAACSDTGTAPPAAAVPVAARPEGQPPVTGLLAGDFGAKLPEADRATAFAAERAAVASGQRKTWRGSNGLFGFVEPDKASGADNCRDYSHTIYIAGRATRGHGHACPAPEGAWRFTT
jgi:surface antigen